MSEAAFREPDLAGRLPALDGFRGLALLLVIVHHWTFLDHSQLAIERKVAAITAYGWCGVELFFVLSGFLITGILLDARRHGARHYFRDFYARRMLRIFPLYYAFIFIFLVVFRYGPVVRHLPAGLSSRPTMEFQVVSPWWFWLYASNFLFATHEMNVLGPTWSLAIEEQFYLVWPAIVLLCGPRRLMKVCAAVIVVAVAWRTVLSWKGITYPMGYMLTPCHTDGLAVGAALAVLARRPSGLLSLVRPALIVGAASVVLLVAMAYATPAGTTLRDSRWAQPLVYTILALAGGAALLLSACAAPNTRIARALGNPVMRGLGKYSYAMYLFNYPLYLILERLMKFTSWPGRMGIRSSLPAQFAVYAIAGVLLFIAAWLSWHLYESQFLKLKRYFPSAAAPRESAVETPDTSEAALSERTQNVLAG